MLTEEEKQLAEQRAMERVRQEIHEAEIKAYEQKVADDARAEFQKEDAKTNILPEINQVLLVCSVAATVGCFMLFKRFAMDLTYDGLKLWYLCVGIAIGLPIFCAAGVIAERMEGKLCEKRNTKTGVRRLLCFSLIGSMLFIGLPRGYVHCPYDCALKERDIDRAEHYQAMKHDHEEFMQGRSSTTYPGLYDYYDGEQTHKDILFYMFWIAFGASCLGLVLSGQLRNSRQV